MLGVLVAPGARGLPAGAGPLRDELTALLSPVTGSDAVWERPPRATDDVRRDAARRAAASMATTAVCALALALGVALVDRRRAPAPVHEATVVRRRGPPLSP